ncbi:PadR family transcriptional regulator [Actinomadura bangladeshensis]|uniref:PadR family transcriptional regulator n=1 Tax=Actinomadura bangladeshensis TaxID=453573 RepID=A0A4R4PD45_9ACTN|nr:PadR family transcriptional regulator [Actinomadura bangladeshensis]TDC18382.1 PadR family transcriptional regulator [Actinomadura bangladeshensis]
MSGIERVTVPLLDALEVLPDAHRRRQFEVHGWNLMRTTHRAGPTIYRVLDRLENAGPWKDANPDPSRPRRRFYELTLNGLARAYDLLEARRPAALGPARRPLGRSAPGPAILRPLARKFAVRRELPGGEA